MSEAAAGAAAYGDGCASFYDALYPAIEPGLISCLADLAGGGPALELGLATGRAALPLAATGVEVHGVEASPAMLDRFRAKNGSGAVRAIAGDFATAGYDTRYRLIYSLVSTFYLLPSLDRQRACLASIARHLAEDGVFVNETYESPPGTAAVTHEHALLLDGQVRAYRVTTLSTPLPVVDDLAAAAGLALHARWSDWRRTPLAPGRPRQISVYGRK